MNYYPYMMNIPYIASAPARTGLLSNLFKSINFSSILNGTGKVLNVANQAIPLIKQAKPVINNARTMFRVMNEFRKSDIGNFNTINNASNTTKNTISNNTNNLSNNTTKNVVENSLPTFFQ